MNNLRTIAVTSLCAAGMLTTATLGQAGTVTYNLASQWANNSNPNGPWSFRQGSTLLPYQSTFAQLGSLAVPNLTSGYAPGNVPGDFLPLIGQAIGPGTGGFTGDFLTGNILFHTVDNSNGNPSLGQFNVDWTAPTSGTITLTGSIWYAQSSVNRSNDFVLELVRGGSVIQTIESGTISSASLFGSSLTNPDPLSSSGSISVQAGDLIELEAYASTGQASGSLDGLDLTIAETTATPEANSLTMAAMGVGVLFVLLRLQRLRKISPNSASN